jgi:hypothetical protein
MSDAPLDGPGEDAMKRWPGIRHLRYYWHRYRCLRHAQMWGRMGIGLGYPNEADLATLDAIWEGRA